jgi:hypothetical protein
MIKLIVIYAAGNTTIVKSPHTTFNNLHALYKDVDWLRPEEVSIVVGNNALSDTAVA